MCKPDLWPPLLKESDHPLIFTYKNIHIPIEPLVTGFHPDHESYVTPSWLPFCFLG